MKFTKTWYPILTTLLATRHALGHYAQPYLTVEADLEICDKIALYSIALDDKNFGLLEDVFTKNVTARLGVPKPGDVTRGRTNLKNGLKVILDSLATQHTDSTIFVNFTNLYELTSISYLVANYLGQGDLTNQTLVFYGKYSDKWAFEDGTWKSKERNLTFFVSPDTLAARIGVAD